MLWRKGFDILLTECCDEGIWYSTNKMLLWWKGFDILLTVVWRKGFDILLTECCGERDLIFY